MTIRVNEVSIISGSDAASPLLENIRCTFEKGTLTLLIGRTGAGKTTFLSALAGLIPLGAGSIEYDGISLWHGSRIDSRVNLKTGIVFQYPERQLFAENISKEFSYSLRPYRLPAHEMNTRMREALHRLHLPDLMVNESALTLSDGMKRRVALATTLAVKPEWLLLDEPTAGIDPQAMKPLTEAIALSKHEGGVIIASHDLDTFLPLADRVILLDKGKIVADTTPRELCMSPDLLLRANVGLSTNIQIYMSLLEHGVRLNGVPLTPSETADAIVRCINKPAGACEPAAGRELADVCTADNRKPVAIRPSLSAPLSVQPSSSAPASAMQLAAPASTKPISLIEKLHPISKWLFYVMVSAGILIQEHWVGLLFAAVVTLGLVSLTGSPYRILAKTRPFVYFLLLSTLISGLRLNFTGNSAIADSVSFSLPPAVQTLKQLTLFLLVMILGILFAVTTNGRSMQMGLEQALSFLERFRLPVAAVTFSASMLLKFIPMLQREMEKMSLVVRARGKSHVKKGSIRWREVHIFLVPLLLSMMKNADDMALALEARGYRLKPLGRNSSYPGMNRIDKAAVGIGAMMSAVLLWIHF